MAVYAYVQTAEWRIIMIKNILFMGTPDFAVESLKALVSEGYELTVVTQQDKPKGRGYTLMPTPVKAFAAENGITVYQPQTLRGEEFEALLEKINPDVIVVAAYGKILPKNVLSFPKYGCINVHGSLLPKYRGAAPIQRAIMDGESKTGITIMQMNEGLDTGDILYQEETPITESDNFETVFDRMAEIGARCLIKSLKLIENGELSPVKQDDGAACYAEKIEKSDCLLDFSLPAEKLFNIIRGLSPIPLAYAYLNGSVLKIVSCRISDKAVKKSSVESADCGRIISGTVVGLDNQIDIVCGNGDILSITEVLPAGKRRMSAADFIRGKKICIGDVLKSAAE